MLHFDRMTHIISLIYTSLLMCIVVVDRKLQFQFIGNFEDFIFQNPGALWQPQLLQQCLKKYNLGIKYWDKKMEQFRVIRENMGIKLL